MAELMRNNRIMSYCPGAKHFKQPQPKDILCPFCSQQVEVWSDEVKAKCPHCKKAIMLAHTQSCLDWCKYAKSCLGDWVG